VPVEVVGLEVEEDADPEVQLVDVLELEGRELADDPVGGARGAERRADVPGDDDVAPGGAEDRAEELAGRRLAVRARDPDDRRLTEEPGLWTVTGKSGETLIITLTEVVSDTSVDLGVDPGLVKDGVEAHLQQLLAVQLDVLGDGWRLVRREYPTPIGPVDLMCRDAAGVSVAVEIKRRGEIDGVEQLTRYLELLNRDPLLTPVQGVFAAQEIRPQARTLATDRGIRCVVLDYDALRGVVRDELTLF